MSSGHLLRHPSSGHLIRDPSTGHLLNGLSILPPAPTLPSRLWTSGGPVTSGAEPAMASRIEWASQFLADEGTGENWDPGYSSSSTYERAAKLHFESTASYARDIDSANWTRGAEWGNSVTLSGRHTWGHNAYSSSYSVESEDEDGKTVTTRYRRRWCTYYYYPDAKALAIPLCETRSGNSSDGHPFNTGMLYARSEDGEFSEYVSLEDLQALGYRIKGVFVKCNASGATGSVRVRVGSYDSLPGVPAVNGSFESAGTDGREFAAGQGSTAVTIPVNLPLRLYLCVFVSMSAAPAASTTAGSWSVSFDDAPFRHPILLGK